jgi:mannosyltransferase
VGCRPAAVSAAADPAALRRRAGRPALGAPHLVFTAPFLCLAAGALLASVRLLPALLVVALAAGLGIPEQAALRRTHDWPRSAPVDYRAAARIIADGQRSGDAVVYSPRTSFLFLDLGVAYQLGAERPRDVLVVGPAGAVTSATECPRRRSA